jgi:2'-hydroxyisoflavone reductase
VTLEPGLLVPMIAGEPPLGAPGFFTCESPSGHPGAMERRRRVVHARFMPNLDRRRFLQGLAVAAAWAPASAWARLLAPQRTLDVLVLGGTNFVGPHLVASALARGHRVALFNRGVTNPDLFPGLERLRGDRLADGGLAALGGERRWDAVVDTWQGTPLAVAESAALLAGRVGHYAYVSSIAVYGSRNYRVPGFHEGAPLLDLRDGPPTEKTVDVPYPARKVYSERALVSALPQAHSLHRAHGIVGLDHAGRLDNPEIGLAAKAWWPVRVAAGGEVLAPGARTDTTQYTDVTDLAAFVVHCIEEQRTGPFNVCETVTMADFLAAIRQEARSDARFTWVPADFLVAQGLESFVDVPLWVSHQEVEGAFYQASTERARAAGLRLRPVAQTFGEVRRSFFLHHAGFEFGDPGRGIALARVEREVLAAWHQAAEADRSR